MVQRKTVSPDSLSYALEQAVSLEDQADLLIELSRYYEPVLADTALLLAQRALDASQRAAYDEGIAQAYLQIAALLRTRGLL